MIFDSCIWVGIAAGQVDPPPSVIAAAGDAPVFTSVICLGELSFWVESCTDPAERCEPPTYAKWIAAQAIEHGYALLTLNPSDFAGLPGLQCVMPSPRPP